MSTKRQTISEGHGLRIQTGDPLTAKMRGTVYVDKHRSPPLDMWASCIEEVDGRPTVRLLKAASWRPDGTADLWTDLETGAALLDQG